MKSFLKDTLSLIVGSVMFSLGLCIFALPNSLLTGGAGGIAIIVNYLTGLPVGMGILIVNIPLFIMTAVICGKGYTLKTFYSTALFSGTVDICDFLISVTYTKNLFVAALLCGILTGVGMYILLRRALVTGGSDLLAFLINKKNPAKAIGPLIFIIDSIIITAGLFIYKDLKQTIFSVLLIFIMSAVITVFLEKKLNAKLFKRNNRPS